MGRSLSSAMVMYVHASVVSVLDGACRVVHNSPAVHLTAACLPDHATRLRTPVLSFPVQQGGDASSSLSHVSLAPGDSSELPVLLDVASKMNWRSAVYVGDANAGERNKLANQRNIVMFYACHAWGLVWCEQIRRFGIVCFATVGRLD